jgi:DNA-directed RNA polymerases I, II, and III subunit RPABC1
MSSQDEILRLWRIHRTCWEMLKDRGYLVPDDRLELSLETFREDYGIGDAVRDSMTIVVPKMSDPQDQVG